MKRIFYILGIITFTFIGIKLVNAEEILNNSNFKFPSSYDLTDESKNTVTSSEEGSLSFTWINIGNLSNAENLLKDASSKCNEYNSDQESEDKKTACTTAIDAMKQAGLFPGYISEGTWSNANNKNVSSKDLTTGKWLLWVSITRNINNYYGYKVYNIEAVEDDPTPNPQEPATTPTPTPPASSGSSSSNQTSSNSNNPNTGVLDITWFIAPLLIILGIYLIVKKNKYQAQ